VAAVFFAALALGGCLATTQEVASNLNDRFVGKNVDELVVGFGPPASTFRMNSGETAYQWQLSSVTQIDTYKGVGAAKTQYCKVTVIASPKGTVTKLTTEDASGTPGVLGAAGLDIRGSVCAQHLGIQRQT
jgi:hypothetical protein